MVKALYGKKLESIDDLDWKKLEAKATSTIKLCLDDYMMYHIMDKESPTTIWLKLKSQ